VVTDADSIGEAKSKSNSGSSRREPSFYDCVNTKSLHIASVCVVT